MKNKIIISIAMAMGLSGSMVHAENSNLIPAANSIHINQERPCQVSPVVTYANPEVKTLVEILAHNLSTVASCEVKTIDTGAEGIILAIDPDNDVFNNLPQTYGTDPSPIDPYNEGYAITIADGNAMLTGQSLRGLRNACSTLLQMVKSENGMLVFPQCEIADAPALAWRGFLLDTSRRFFPVEEVKTVIDVLALYKMNVLHLHMTDNQGWRFEVKGYPALSDDYYTQEEYSDLVDYAWTRGITIVPELDLPGHSAAIFKAFPHFSNTASLPFEFNFPGQDICALDPDDTQAMEFVRDAITQLCALTPSEYVHIGGDETFGMQDEPYAKFVKQAKDIVRSCGKQVAGWQEMARADVGAGDVVQNWIKFSKKQMELSKANSEKKSSLPEEVSKMLGATYMKAPSDLPTSADSGAKILLSPQAFAYCDCPFEEENLDASYAERSRELGLKNYAPQNLQDIYEWEPAALYPFLNPEEHIAGVEGTLFCETIRDLGDALIMILPRISSISEHAWNCGRELDWNAYSQRLGSHGKIYESQGWPFFKSSMINWEE